MNRRREPAWFALGTRVLISAIAIIGCDSPPRPNAPASWDSQPHPGTAGRDAVGVAGERAVPVVGADPGPTAVPEDDTRAFNALRAQADAAGARDESETLAAYPVRFLAGLGYDPKASLGLDTIQSSSLALSDGELSKLGQQGFVVSTRREFPTFVRGLAEIYSEHLPLYVSADALLESIHSSYDAILLGVETQILVPDLHALLSGMHARLSTSDADPGIKAGLDLYLSVARGMLEGHPPTPVAGADAALVSKLIASASAAAGIENFELFGVDRTEDFSQFAPRGHYTDDPTLEAYFRAMMWLGRVDLRLIETLPNGDEVFRPEQFRATLALTDLIAPDVQRWQRIDDTVRTFVGESDSMTVPEVGKLVSDLGGPQAARSADDAAVVAAIAAGGYGRQQIASHLMVNDGTVKRLPLNRSFLVFGQRYIADSHVFSEAVYDRVAGRMMPNPLDAAFAALGNNQALALQQAELSRYPELPGALGRMRVLLDAHDADFWQANFYNLWLTALRALSPAPDLTKPASPGLPEVARTEAWGRRILNAQLGSWAELRHDTLLYAKQSYTGSPGCEYPDAYVDPYPALYDAIVKYAEQGDRIAQIAAQAPATDFAPRVTDYFEALRNAAGRLGEMARAQQNGQPFTAEQLAFINDAVRIDDKQGGCVTVEVPDGWYADLFFEHDKSIEFDPTIADVHTQPADEAGTIVGKVLHVGTGYPRYMVTTIDTCTGPRAYAGVVYAYHEQVTENFQRLTDPQWAERFQTGAARPAEVPWMTSVLAQ